MISYRIIGNHIREARERLNLTQADAAYMLGISQTYYGKMERAVIKQNLEKLSDICEAFHIPLESLLEGAHITSDVEMDNVPIATEEFDSFFHELGDMSDDSTKRLMMRICREIVAWKAQLDTDETPEK